MTGAVGTRAPEAERGGTRGALGAIEKRSRRQLLFFAFAFAACSLAVVLAKRHDLLPWIGACSAGGYADDAYLAYCNDARYGDYEHYAFLNATEPGQIEALQAADVLFLGNSRAQFGFSTDAIERGVEALDVPYYVFGFGLGGTSDVPLAVIRRHGIDARMLVINADPFFSTVVNPAFSRVRRGGAVVDWEHRLKRLEQRLQRSVCAGDGPWARLGAALCRGDEVTVFRSVDTGRWDGRWFAQDERYPISYAELPEADRERDLDRAERIARDFIAESGVEPGCIVLTVVPHEDTREVFGLELATRLGTRWAAPDVPGLETFDRSHLTRDSAERWSAALFEAIAPDVERCTA